MDGDVSLVESGGATDFAYGPKPQYPPAHVDRILHDGDTVTLGGVRLTAHKTAGHTRGCTTWTMRVHLPGEPAAQLRNVVIVGSWNVQPGLSPRRTRTASPHPIPASPATSPTPSSSSTRCPATSSSAHTACTSTCSPSSRACRSRATSVWIDPDWLPPRHRRTQSRIREGTRKTASRRFSSLAPSPASPAPPDDDGHAPPSSRRSSTPSSFRAPDA